jgi:hypothetical protein
MLKYLYDIPKQIQDYRNRPFKQIGVRPAILRFLIVAVPVINIKTFTEMS